MKYIIIFFLILSGCQSYDCTSITGKETLAEIQMMDTSFYLTSKSVQQICEIIRKDMKK